MGPSTLRDRCRRSLGATLEREARLAELACGDAGLGGHLSLQTFGRRSITRAILLNHKVHLRRRPTLSSARSRGRASPRNFNACAELRGGLPVVWTSPGGTDEPPYARFGTRPDLLYCLILRCLSFSARSISSPGPPSSRSFLKTKTQRRTRVSGVRVGRRRRNGPCTRAARSPCRRTRRWTRSAISSTDSSPRLAPCPRSAGTTRRWRCASPPRALPDVCLRLHGRAVVSSAHRPNLAPSSGACSKEQISSSRAARASTRPSAIATTTSMPSRAGSIPPPSRTAQGRAGAADRCIPTEDRLFQVIDERLDPAPRTREAAAAVAVRHDRAGQRVRSGLLSCSSIHWLGGKARAACPPVSPASTSAGCRSRATRPRASSARRKRQVSPPACRSSPPITWTSCARGRTGDVHIAGTAEETVAAISALESGGNAGAGERGQAARHDVVERPGAHGRPGRRGRLASARPGAASRAQGPTHVRLADCRRRLRRQRACRTHRQSTPRTRASHRPRAHVGGNAYDRFQRGRHSRSRIRPPYFPPTPR